MPEFKPFDLGNVLAQAENIKGARSQNVLREQQIDAGEALKQREAAFNPLFQQFLAGGENAPTLNELAAVDPEKTAVIQNFLSEQQALDTARNEAVREQEQREADIAVRGALFVKRSDSPKVALELGFPEFVAQLEEQGVEIGDLDDSQVLQMADGLIQQLGPVSSLSLEELGLEPEELRSTAGKQLEDRQKIAEQFGEGSEELARFDAATAKGKGFSVTLPDGTVISAGGPQELQKKTLGQTETDIVGADDAIARINAIASGFKPEFLEFGGRLGAKLSSLKAKFGKDLSGEQKQFLTEFSSFQRDAIENINLEIKRITGAQMSEKEANRIRQGFPDPGEGVFDGDDPITFQSKLRGVMRSLSLTRARRMTLLRDGINIDNLSQKARDREFGRLALPVDKTDNRGIVGVMNGRIKAVRDGGGDDEAVRKMLQEEFGR